MRSGAERRAHGLLGRCQIEQVRTENVLFRAMPHACTHVEPCWAAAAAVLPRPSLRSLSPTI